MCSFDARCNHYDLRLAVKMAMSMYGSRLPLFVKCLFYNGLCLLRTVREEIWHILCGKIDPEDSQLRFSRMGKNKSGPEALISRKNSTN